MPQKWDGIISQHLNRRLSRPIARFLASHTKVTPNQVTFASFITAILSAFLFFPFGTVILAGIIVHLSSVLDGVDGDLAKLSNKVTVTGGFLDSVLDRYADIAILVGIGGYSHFLEGNEYAVPCVFAAIIGSLMVSYTRAASEKIQGFSFRSPISNYLSNRDVRLFAVFIGSVLAFVLEATGYPIISSMLVFIAVTTNTTVIRRIIEMGRHKVCVGNAGSNASLECHTTAGINCLTSYMVNDSSLAPNFHRS